MNPVISRTIEIRADQTLNQLQGTIIEAFGSGDDCHLGEFRLGDGIMDTAGERYVLPFVFAQPLASDPHPPTGSMTQVRLGGLGLGVGGVLWYRHDFEHDWGLEIMVQTIGEAEPEVRYPRVVARAGGSPPRRMDDDV